MSGEIHAVAARRVFDGVEVHADAAVLLEGSRIAAVVPRDRIPRSTPVRELPGETWLAPGFIDIQVNGGGDVLFNDEPTPDAIRTIVAAHRKFGTTALLPTLISDSPEKMAAALAAVDQVAGLEPSVLGIHLEGPFLSPAKAGVHDPHMLRPPSEKDLATLTARRNGVTLVTLAPEVVPEQFIADLAAAGVRISLGHSMATYAQTKAAMTAGAAGFTHLFNAIRPLESREPGPIAAALESPRAWYGLIVDGVHVAPAMLRLALRGAGHPILVTDAMPPVGGTRKSFTLQGKTIVVRDGRCSASDGRLAGACLDMASAVRNCVRLLNVSLPSALRFASTNPAEFLGCGQMLGRLAPGFRADMVALDANNIEVLATWVAGGLSQGSEKRIAE
jgi:N-acetylglucosamine-6-phosphate deacetylase